MGSRRRGETDGTDEISLITSQISFLERELSIYMKEFRSIEYSLGGILTHIKDLERSIDCCRNSQTEASCGRSLRRKPRNGKLDKLMDDMEYYQVLKINEKEEISAVRHQINMLNSTLEDLKERKEELEECERMRRAEAKAREVSQKKAEEKKLREAEAREAAEERVISFDSLLAPSPPTSPASALSSPSPPSSPDSQGSLESVPPDPLTPREIKPWAGSGDDL